MFQGWVRYIGAGDQDRTHHGPRCEVQVWAENWALWYAEVLEKEYGRTIIDFGVGAATIAPNTVTLN